MSEPIVVVVFQNPVPEFRVIGLEREQKKFSQPEAYLELLRIVTSFMAKGSRDRIAPFKTVEFKPTKGSVETD
jgi:hypothetical protein